MGNIVWQSEFFPQLIVTDRMLEIWKRAYPNVKKFQPELLRAEAWLEAHPTRHPKKNWKAFLNNWMRNADEFALAKQKRPPEYGQSARELHTTPKQLTEILSQIRNNSLD